MIDKDWLRMWSNYLGSDFRNLGTQSEHFTRCLLPGSIRHRYI